MARRPLRRDLAIKKAGFLGQDLVRVLESILIERSYFLSSKGFVVKPHFVHLAYVGAIWLLCPAGTEHVCISICNIGDCVHTVATFINTIDIHLSNLIVCILDKSNHVPDAVIYFRIRYVTF